MGLGELSRQIVGQLQGFAGLPRPQRRPQNPIHHRGQSGQSLTGLGQLHGGVHRC